MPTYERNSRFNADDDYRIATRQGTTSGTVVMMKTPVRGPDDSLYLVPLKHQFRWDLITLELLGDPSLKWVLMRHNRIDDPFAGPLVGDNLFIPTQDQVRYYVSA